MIAFVGTSFAPTHLKEAATQKGFKLTDKLREANLIFISEDTPTENGVRDLNCIRSLIASTLIVARAGTPIVLTSQVPPGFTRSLVLPLYHMAETLRVKDAPWRALHPEQFIIGCQNPEEALPVPLALYCDAFECPIFKMTWEEAEFSKIAINMTLASQVDNTNRLARAAQKVNARWEVIAPVLRYDRRIGQHAYLEPGRWQGSAHLMRDYVTLAEIEDRDG